MLKYKDVMVTFEEVPSEVSLCINITGCPIHCPDCHSKHLWKDIGTELNYTTLQKLIKENDGISCVSFMGGDNCPSGIYELAKWLKEHTKLKVCWYSGAKLREDFPLEYFDFLKTGPYNKELGGLDSITTNQRFYQVKYKEIKTILGSKESYYYLEDITNKFWKDVGNNKDE